jgi:hypothetical protein
VRADQEPAPPARVRVAPTSRGSTTSSPPCLLPAWIRPPLLWGAGVDASASAEAPPDADPPPPRRHHHHRCCCYVSFCFLCVALPFRRLHRHPEDEPAAAPFRLQRRRSWSAFTAGVAAFPGGCATRRRSSSSKLVRSPRPSPSTADNAPLPATPALSAGLLRGRAGKPPPHFSPSATPDLSADLDFSATPALSAVSEVSGCAAIAWRP